MIRLISLYIIEKDNLTVPIVNEYLMKEWKDLCMNSHMRGEQFD